jgi:cysteine desulfurase
VSVYLDHNATSAIRPEAAGAMADALNAGGNPSSVHAPGRAARATVERARETLAHHMKKRAEDIVFTSGGTEANNLAIASAKASGATRLIVSAIEHEAVIEAAQNSGLPVEIWPVTGEGVVELNWLEDRLKGWDRAAEGVPFICLMAANNETGAIQPVEPAGLMVREAGGLLHVDAVQAPGKMDLAVTGLAHYVAVSGHKAGGPLGAGALALDCDAPLTRQMHGGGQEKGRRSGTENVPAIAGFAAALDAAAADEDLWERLAFLRDLAEAKIRSQAGDAVTVWAAGAERLPNTLCLSAPGWPSEIQVIALDLAGFAVSAGSACSSGKVRRSRVLEAMGAGPDHAGSALRVSFGWNSTEKDAIAFADAWLDEFDRARPKVRAAAAI